MTIKILNNISYFFFAGTVRWFRRCAEFRI